MALEYYKSSEAQLSLVKRNQPKGKVIHREEVFAKLPEAYSFKGEIVFSADAYSAYLAEVSQHPLLTPLQLTELVRQRDAAQSMEDRKDAISRIVEGNLRLVIDIARNHSYPKLTQLEIIQEGNIGLLKAAETFDLKRETQFTTHAMWQIRGAIDSAIKNTKKTVRIPKSIYEKRAKILKGERRLEEIFERPATGKEIARYLTTTEAQVTKIKNYVQDEFSLDEPLNPETHETRGDLLEDHSSVFETTLANTLETEDLLSSLKERERRVLELRYAFDGEEGRTYDAIGEELGISGERARQLEAQALEKLRGGLTIQPKELPKTSTEKELLPQREHEVLQLIGKGFTNAAIAERFSLHARTTSKLLEKVFRRYSVASGEEAVLAALAQGDLSLEEIRDTEKTAAIALLTPGQLVLLENIVEIIRNKKIDDQDLFTSKRKQIDKIHRTLGSSRRIEAVIAFLDAFSLPQES